MEPLKHECGVVQIRLRKPLRYYQEKYGTWQYGLNKLYLLMEKQHNRGQEGAGLACVKIGAQVGEEFMFRERAEGSNAITKIFEKAHQAIQASCPTHSEHLLGHSGSFAPKVQWEGTPFAGECYMGHVRYSADGRSGISFVHPFLRRNNWRARNLSLCGNFSLTNGTEIFQRLTENGQHPRLCSDAHTILEQVGHRLDRESERLWNEAVHRGLTGLDITQYIEEHIDLTNVLRETTGIWDGGYVICGLTGSGEQFTMRDPWGIRTAFYYADDEIVVLASERPVLQTAFNLQVEDVHELEPGQALLVSKNGDYRLEQILPAAAAKRACSFERVYFSRQSDYDIYRERKMLGTLLLNPILKAIDGDVENTVFSFIPNTAEVAYYGMTEAFDVYVQQKKLDAVWQMKDKPTRETFEKILLHRCRREKVALKDIKMRTFITESNSRNDLAAHVYDITYGSLRAGQDNLVIIDDSIVRGTTLRESIISILDRLKPKKMVIVSSAPQVRYPDYYGIDMSRMSEFIAFRAAVALLEEQGKLQIVHDVYAKCIHQRHLPAAEMQNYVKEIYAPFTDEEISAKMVEMLRAPGVTSDIEIVFQSVEGLHEACPNHLGDWYFTGDYPTPGGVRKLNETFITYFEETYR